MDIQHFIAFARGNVTTIVLAVVAAGVAACLIATVAGRKPNRPRKLSSNELRFRNVFAMMSEERRQSLISYYARKHECSREEAMLRAVEDRSRDEGRW